MWDHVGPATTWAICVVSGDRRPRSLQWGQKIDLAYIAVRRLVILIRASVTCMKASDNDIYVMGEINSEECPIHGLKSGICAVGCTEEPVYSGVC